MPLHNDNPAAEEPARRCETGGSSEQAFPELSGPDSVRLLRMMRKRIAAEERKQKRKLRDSERRRQEQARNEQKRRRVEAASLEALLVAEPRLYELLGDARALRPSWRSPPLARPVFAELLERARALVGPASAGPPPLRAWRALHLIERELYRITQRAGRNRDLLTPIRPASPDSSD